MILNLHDKQVERRALSLLLNPPTHMRVLGLTPDSFAIREHRDFFILLKKYVAKYRAAPSIATLELFANDTLTDDNSESLLNALDIGRTLPKIKKGEANFYFEKLENYRIGRGLYDLGVKLKETIEESPSDFLAVKKDMLSGLLSLGGDQGHVKRGFFTSDEEVKNRYQQYREAASGEASSNIIPFGIKALDDSLGGVRKTFVTMLFSKTGGGKTRTMMNVAYNAASMGYNVMYFTLEMSFDLIASCFDSRMAEIDSNQIIFGKLQKEDRLKYKQALKRQMKDGLNLWLVDIPTNASMDRVLEEIEVYIGANGVAPDLIAIDYSHLVIPTYNAPDRSTKFDNLFKEIHETAKYYNTGIITAAPESHTRTKADATKGQRGKPTEEIEEGTQDIGASNFMAFHCETILRLKQSKADRLRHRMEAIPVKNRYGKIGEPIELYTDWATNYVGDSLGMKIKKYPKKQR